MPTPDKPQLPRSYGCTKPCRLEVPAQNVGSVPEWSRASSLARQELEDLVPFEQFVALSLHILAPCMGYPTSARDRKYGGDGLAVTAAVAWAQLPQANPLSDARPQRVV